MAGSIKIEIKNLSQIKAAFNKAPALMTTNLNTAIKKTIFFIEGKAVTNAPAVTGRLRASAYTDFSPLKGETGFTANYALFVHSGTRPHDIYPANKKALWWKGAAHPMKVVHHPGYKGNPFLQKAVDQSGGDVDKFFEDAVQQTLDTIGKESS